VGDGAGRQDGESFSTTDWSLIAVAKGSDPARARGALCELCRSYWYPLYAYIRRRGYTPDRAADLTQGFFASLFEHDFLARIGPECGRFRGFLLASCRNYLANQHDRERAAKRGGARLTLSIDVPDAEARFAREASHDLTAERLFDRRWALTLLNDVLERLRAEMRDAGKGRLFDRLSAALLGDGSAAPYRQIAGEFSTSEAGIKTAAFRLRRRFHELLVAEVARTVATPESIEEEVRDLFAALRN
jgi:RNA polymerase sigma-70 factor (ECF subfamily)